MKKLLILFTLFISLSFILTVKGQTTALLIIDIQDFYFPGGKSVLVEPETAANYAALLLEKFRKENRPVIHVRHNSEPGGKIYESLKPIAGEKIISKDDVSAFKGTDLLDYLKQNKIDTLVICGMQTHMCVEAATRAASDLGFKCILIHDACATKDLRFGDHIIKASDVHYSTLSTLRNYASVMSTYEYISSSTGSKKLNDPIIIRAPELYNLNFDLSTGGLPVVPGLETYTVIRSDRENPEAAEGLGWTYQHHPDIAVWHGRLYVGWNSCQKDEDTWPSRELLSSSSDGKVWSKPVEMFPMGVSTPLRMYFYLAPNKRMLIIAGLRKNHDKTSERNKAYLVVRELKADHTLGEIFTLKSPPEKYPLQPESFEKSNDKGFKDACRQLLADKIYLEQQDYGNLLDPSQRMKWNDPSAWNGSDELKKEAGNFGKGMSFFERKDGAIVGLGKKRWVTVSHDNGKTWDQPVRPLSLISGMGKVWGQKTPDERYALVYNPDLSRRWPLIIVTSDDGITFGNPMAVHGELPQRRYDGLYKDPGLSYHRGLSKWNNDCTRTDNAMWMVYSLNKEDIRVIRIPFSK
jgi:nicotinamidase-related amidase